MARQGFGGLGERALSELRRLPEEQWGPGSTHELASTKSEGLARPIKGISMAEAAARSESPPTSPAPEDDFMSRFESEWIEFKARQTEKEGHIKLQKWL